MPVKRYHLKFILIKKMTTELGFEFTVPPERNVDSGIPTLSKSCPFWKVPLAIEWKHQLPSYACRVQIQASNTRRQEEWDYDFNCNSKLEISASLITYEPYIQLTSLKHQTTQHIQPPQPSPAPHKYSTRVYNAIRHRHAGTMHFVCT